MSTCYPTLCIPHSLSANETASLTSKSTASFSNRSSWILFPLIIASTSEFLHDLGRYNIAQHEYLTLLGVTFQCNCLFAKHVKTKLNEANKCLYINRELKKEGYSQDEIDHLFKAIVLPKIMYGLPVYATCQAILNTAQYFLERCFKRHYSSKLYNINELLEKCGRKLFNKISSDSSHPLYPMLPQAKASSLRLRQSTSQLPKINTKRFKSSFF